MDFSRDDREKHLITRGNVDGIVSAAIFLSTYPSARITFVTSPRAGAQALAKDRYSTDIFLVDIALIDEVLTSAASRHDHQTVYAMDHHPSSVSESLKGVKVVQEGLSAAGILYQFFQASPHLKKTVAIADLLEYCDTPILTEMKHKHGLQKLDEESKVLDFSWRLNIDDDEFRMVAARELAQGIWPSQSGAIKRRYLQVVNEQRWPKAIAGVKAGLTVREEVGIFHCHEKNRSLYGFGTRALVDVAYRRGCKYAMMVNERRENSSISLRGIDRFGIDVGLFVEDFVERNGMEGGGHPTSAGGRIALQVTDRFVDEFVAASLTR